MRHFDVIVATSSLAGQIAATLIARAGRSVLHLQGDRPAGIAWFQSTLILEQLLDELEGHSCFGPPIPFQVLTPDVRVEINDSTPLNEVLRREFGEEAPSIQRFLDECRTLGERLESFYRKKGLPLPGIGTSLGGGLKRLGAGLPKGRLHQKLPGAIRETGNQTAETFLTTLFSGLSGSPASELHVWEAALLWAGATRPRGISPSGLEALLRHRGEQAGLISAPLARAQNLAITGGKPTCTAEGIGPCSATHLVTGPETRHLLGLPLAEKGDRLRYTSSPLDGMLSPLLARRVITGDGIQARLSFGTKNEQTLCALDLIGSEPMSAVALKNALVPVLPFARYELTERPADPAPFLPVKKVSWQRIPYRHKKIWIADSPSLLSALGTTGEVLLGTGIARKIAPKKTAGK